MKMTGGFETEYKFAHNGQVYLIFLEVDYTVNGQVLPPTAEEPAEGYEMDQVSFKVVGIDDLDGPIDDLPEYREVYNAFVQSPNTETKVEHLAIEDFFNQ
jgi:hypothetical protein